ncbi:hypothetical protein [Christiangramia crocea]|uniref:Uncharacterized protein n=1 Tax=Christiangramia crocea TaxID=2904124 RepID=A0A9X1UVF3_9FLAO|nr:hypothetical protein [Gramella crocea]MCG9971030.1 hypothetical protein [Gramella crocea]
METQLTKVNPVMDIIPKDSEGNPKYQNLQEFKQLVNTAPRKTWIKTNKFSQNAKYLPIGIVEELLSGIFPFWQVEQHGEPKILGNSIVISVHLKVFNPLLGQWQSYAGVGAVPIELKGGSDPTDFTQMNSKAMHKNVPAALSFAVNNAAKKIGKLFGSHLNRNETIG